VKSLSSSNASLSARSVRSAMVGMLSLVAACGALAAGPGWTPNSTVAKLVVTFNGGVNVRLIPELTGCVSQSGYGSAFASIYPSHPGINRLKAMLLAAQMNGTPVTLYFSDSNCTVTEAMLGGW
jgi:hypothetical protein